MNNLSFSFYKESVAVLKSFRNSLHLPYLFNYHLTWGYKEGFKHEDSSNFVEIIKLSGDDFLRVETANQ